MEKGPISPILEKAYTGLFQEMGRNVLAKRKAYSELLQSTIFFQYFIKSYYTKIKTPFYLFFYLFLFIYLLFIYLFLALLGLRFCARAFSSCGKRGQLFIAVRGPLTIAASLVAEHRLQTRRLSNCGSRA